MGGPSSQVLLVVSMSSPGPWRLVSTTYLLHFLQSAAFAIQIIRAHTIGKGSLYHRMSAVHGSGKEVLVSNLYL